MRVIPLLVLILVLFASNVYAAVPGCPGGAMTAQTKACELGIRAKEYTIRRMYSHALEKANLAHFYEFDDPARVDEISRILSLLTSDLESGSAATMRLRYPDLSIETDSDRLRIASFMRLRSDLASSYGAFTDFMHSLDLSSWSDRATAGRNAFGAIPLLKMSTFVRFMDFMSLDIRVAADYLQSGGVQLNVCKVFYPFQFASSKTGMEALVASASAFSDVSCQTEIYRALIAQSFLSKDGYLIDSNFIVIPYLPAVDKPESLSVPAPVLSARIADPKFVQSYMDSVVAVQTQQQKTDIDSNRLTQVSVDIRGLMDRLGLAQAERVSFFRQSIQYGSKGDSIVLKRLAVQFADDLKQAEARHP